MDYKELVRLYRSYAARFENGEQLLLGGEIRLQDALREAADAIETLLAERDAFMKDVVRCDTCLHVKECYFNKLRRIDCAQSNRGLWQWRGPQKGGGEP